MLGFLGWRPKKSLADVAKLCATRLPTVATRQANVARRNQMIRRRATITALAVAALTPFISMVAPATASAKPTACYTKTFYNGVIISSCPRGTPPNRIPGIALPPRAEGNYGTYQPNPSIIKVIEVGQCVVFVIQVAESAASRGLVPMPYVDPLTCTF
jgi:hypothetical protein